MVVIKLKNICTPYNHLLFLSLSLNHGCRCVLLCFDVLLSYANSYTHICSASLE